MEAGLQASIERLIKENPDYAVIVTGHSLSGAMASIAALELSAQFPSTTFKLFTFGQPRTGDLEYVTLHQKYVS
jgi:predicted lipase